METLLAKFSQGHHKRTVYLMFSAIYMFRSFQYWFSKTNFNVLMPAMNKHNFYNVASFGLNEIPFTEVTSRRPQ